MVKKKKLNKTGNKTLRLFQQTDFAVDFWSRQGRMFYNGWIEKAIEAYADQLSDETDVNWREVYDPDDSVRQLRVFALNPSFYPFSDEELEERAFVLEHHAFFYTKRSSGKPGVIRANARVLFPRLREFMATQEKNFAATQKEMTKALRDQGLSVDESKP